MKPIPNSRLRKIRTWNLGTKPGELVGLDENKKAISLVDLASNDYLGLSTNKQLIQAAQTTMLSEGIGAGASRLVTGSRPIHQKLEAALSKWLGFQNVLLFPSGFQANLAAVSALANRHSTVIADKLIHHSLLVGIKISGAKIKRFAHNDINDLERIIQICLKSRPDNPPLIITESLFSMEGTSPDIKKISSLCKNYQCMLLVDEAHALGILGSQGRGLCYGQSEQVTMVSGTFGKAFGSGGAFLATNKEIGNYMLQTSGAFRYTTALAPPLAAASLESLKLIQENPDWKKDLQNKSVFWQSALRKEGWSLPKVNGPIIPLILGSDEKSIQTQRHLENEGLLTIAIRPPTVPEGTSRLRLVVRRNLEDNTLDKLIYYLSKHK